MPDAPIDNKFRICDFEGSLPAYCVVQNHIRCIAALMDAGASFDNPVDEKPAYLLASELYRPTAALMVVDTEGVDADVMEQRARDNGHIDVAEKLGALAEISGESEWKKLEAQVSFRDAAAPDAGNGQEAPSPTASSSARPRG